MSDEKKSKEEQVIGDEEQVVNDEQKLETKHSLFKHRCKKCEKLEQEGIEYKAGWQRAQADYQNLKKEIENMRGEWARYSEQQILEEFIPVYDNFRKAFKDTEYADSYAEDADNADIVKKFENWRKGIEMIMKQFEKVLRDHGVEEIKTVGEVFNPELHEAIAEEDSDQSEHVILKEVEAGYMMRGKVMKVAKVIVAK